MCAVLSCLRCVCGVVRVVSQVCGDCVTLLPIGCLRDYNSCSFQLLISNHAPASRARYTGNSKKGFTHAHCLWLSQMWALLCYNYIFVLISVYHQRLQVHLLIVWYSS